MNGSYDYAELQKMDDAYSLAVKALFGEELPDERSKSLIASSILCVARLEDMDAERLAAYAISSVRLLIHGSPFGSPALALSDIQKPVD